MLVTAIVVPAAALVRPPRREYYREQRAGRASWSSDCISIAPPTWTPRRRGSGRLTGPVTAYCNVCFSPEHVTLEELQRSFNTDVEERLRSPVDLTTLDWVWDRLGRTGPHGRSYQQRFEPEYREGLATMREHR